MRVAPSGQPVANFPVATRRKFKNGDGQEVNEVTWFRVSAWGKTGEACSRFLKKGEQVFIEGRLIPDPATGGPRLWTRQDGHPAASFEIHADLVRFLGGKYNETNGQAETSAGATTEKEIPF
jgi:single-strand DNA-binding protein